MVSKQRNPIGEPADATWGEIEQLVDDLARHSKSEMPPPEFYQQLLDHTVSAMAALGGVIWLRGDAGQLRAENRFFVSDLMESFFEDPCHRSLAGEVAQSHESVVVPPISLSNGTNPDATPYLLMLCPFTIESDAVGVIEVVQRPDMPPAARRGHLQLLAAVGEIAAEYHRNCELRTLREREAWWERVAQFTRHIHGRLDVAETAYRIASDGRRWIGCDRLSVLTRRGNRWTLRAMSGVDTWNRRANAVRRLEGLASLGTAVQSPLWYQEGLADGDVGIAHILNDYLDESPARVLGVIPLIASDTDRIDADAQSFAALVVEHFSALEVDSFQPRVDAIRASCGLALQNAVEVQTLPLLPVMRGLREAGKFLRPPRLARTCFVALTLAAIGCALWFVPADFQIEAPGELQPLIRQHIFAPADGVVSRLNVNHGDSARIDEVLLEMRQPELDVEYQRVFGELQTARKKLDAVQASRLSGSPETSESRMRNHRWTADEEELKPWINSLERQRDILERQREGLLVSSPIAGQIVTWNLRQRLEARPVTRGQTLMTIADLDGPWVVELRVADHRIGHVLAAREAERPDLEVSFILESDPEVRRRGRIHTLALATEVDDAHGPYVRISVAIEGDIPRLRPGTTVMAKVGCGRRPVGYVWFHELLEAWEKRVLF